MPVAFPTAEGFGAPSVGGRGGTVLFVTNLNDSGAGSFRAAVTASGARIVIFKVSGTIQIASQITINNPFLTIAGQTSPGGIQIRGTLGTPTGISFGSGCHDVIVRHLRVRIGGNEANDDGESLIVFASSASPNHCHNIIFDHVSVEWGHDGEAMVYGNWDNLTWQYCLIAEPIADETHTTGNGREGMHIGGTTLDMTNLGRISVHHNILAHCRDRNPNMTRARIFDLRCNIVYNWDFNNGGRFGQSAFNWSAFGNVVNNYYKLGPNSSTTNRSQVVDNAGGELGGTKIYSEGNWGTLLTSGGADDWVLYRTDASNNNQAPEATYRVSTPFPVAAVTTEATGDLLALLTPHVGASVPPRDSVDADIIADVINGTGAIPSTTYAGGPWPDLASGAPAYPTDTNDDGIPDAWAVVHGFGVNETIANTVGPGDWTYLEHYLNEKAGDPSQFSGGGGAAGWQIVQVSVLAETASGNALAPTLSGVTAGNTLVYVAASRITGTSPALGTPTNYTELFESGSQNNTRLAMGIRYNAPAGVNTPSISMVANSRGSAFLIEISGLVNAGSTDTSVATASSTTLPSSGNVTPPGGTPALIIGAVVNTQTQTTITANAAWELVVEDETVDVGLAMSIITHDGSAGDISATWTLGNPRDWIAGAIALEGVEVGVDLTLTPGSVVVSTQIPVPMVGLSQSLQPAPVVLLPAFPVPDVFITESDPPPGGGVVHLSRRRRRN